MLHAWGMTEMTPLGTVCRLKSYMEALPEDERYAIRAKQGLPAPCVDMRIVGEDGEEQPWDGQSMGEIQVRGPWITATYLGDATPDPDKFSPDGWLRTGDVGVISPEGFLTLTDRAKDVIKSGGEWISSVELENALMAHPKVMEAAVIAIPDARWGERPLAAVVPAPGVETVSEAELIDALAAEFARFQLPDRIIVTNAIPKTSVGKFDKKVLRQQFAEGKLV